MAMYKYTKGISLIDFDITKSISYHAKLSKERTKMIISRTTEQKIDKRSYESEDDEENTRSSSPVSKKHHRSRSSSIEERSSSSSPRPGHIPRSIIISEKTLDVLNQVLEAVKPYLKIERNEFPRIKNIAVFLRDVYFTETEFRGKLRSVFYAKFAEEEGVLQSVKFELGSKSQQLIEEYKRFAIRVLLAHYSSLYARQKSKSYREALAYVCACLDTVYAADKKFFALAHDNLQILRSELPSTSSSKNSPTNELEVEFVIRAAAKGVISEGASSFAAQQENAANSFA